LLPRGRTNRQTGRHGDHDELPHAAHPKGLCISRGTLFPITLS
jgi:hypothetical protein